MVFSFLFVFLVEKRITIKGYIYVNSFEGFSVSICCYFSLQPLSSKQMAQPLPVLTAAQIVSFVDGLAVGEEVSITWSSTAVTAPQVWVGSVLSADAAAHVATISYPNYGVHRLPPVHAANLHKLEKATHVDPWAAAIRSAQAGNPLPSVSFQDPASWDIFIGGATDAQKQVSLFQFQQWIRGRHGLTSTDRSQNGGFERHQVICLVRSLEQWVTAAQLNVNWRAQANLAIATEIVGTLERYVLHAEGACLKTFSLELHRGKTVAEAVLKAKEKKLGKN